MKVYLDTKDIINIFEHSIPFTRSEFKQKMQRGNHQLVVSYYTVTEIAKPLFLRNSQTVVTGLLNSIEEIPATYISAELYTLELKEAVNAFTNKREVEIISPFVNRFDHALPLEGPPPTENFINYSLAGIVWDLFGHRGLEGLDRFANPMRKHMLEDRMIQKPPNLNVNFVKTIEWHFKLFSIPSPNSPVSDLANWIYQNPCRCPSIRLTYEVLHQVVKNKTDVLEDSDMEDYQHLSYLPYVDLMTLDKRMFNYVSQALKTLNLDYSERLFKSVGDAIDYI